LRYGKHSDTSLSRKSCDIYIYTMGSQKVPWMAVLHCNGRTYGNDYLPNQLQSRTLARTNTHTHKLAPSNVPLLETQAEGFLWNLQEFGRRIRCYVLHGS
jgi:hypothetical protein